MTSETKAKKVIASNISHYSQSFKGAVTSPICSTSKKVDKRLTFSKFESTISKMECKNVLSCLLSIGTLPQAPKFYDHECILSAV